MVLVRALNVAGLGIAVLVLAFLCIRFRFPEHAPFMVTSPLFEIFGEKSQQRG